MPILARSPRDAGRCAADQSLCLSFPCPSLRFGIECISWVVVADPVTGLIMVPIISLESVEVLRGEKCDECY